MLDIKVKYVLEQAPTILRTINDRYGKNLDLYGIQDPTLGVYFDMLIAALKLSQLSDPVKMGYNLTLELYKKVAAVLRDNGLALIIPPAVPIPPSAMYPTFYGVFAKNLPASNIPFVLTADNSAQSNKNYFMSPDFEVYYFASPVEYGPLVNIKDQNQFDVTPGFLVRTENIIIGVDLIPYYIYEFKNFTTQSGFGLHFNYTL
jgi:hypothetical protein